MTKTQLQNALERVIVVLVQPRSSDNIGGVVRAMKNMGLKRLRVVNPFTFEIDRIQSVAHRSADFVKRIELYDDLRQALADVTLVVSTSSRRRELGPRIGTPKSLAPEILAHAQVGNPAILFGREDFGLPSDIVTRSHYQMVIPTDPAYPSLNLAQAVLLVAYELRQAALGDRPPDEFLPRIDPRDPPATEAEFNAAVESILEVLDRAGFFKPGQEPAKRIKIDRLLRRTHPTSSEAGLLRAMGYVLGKAIRRRTD
ncbi:MAG: TrmJ/YjtD family RNA methyltransferase [Chloroflexi bacterium]|nr:TrmJ/YjtD family RNA methyltransferase [Chloroflexota bacterium]